MKSFWETVETTKDNNLVEDFSNEIVALGLDADEVIVSLLEKTYKDVDRKEEMLLALEGLGSAIGSAAGKFVNNMGGFASDMANAYTQQSGGMNPQVVAGNAADQLSQIVNALRQAGFQDHFLNQLNQFHSQLSTYAQTQQQQPQGQQQPPPIPGQQKQQSSWDAGMERVKKQNNQKAANAYAYGT